MDTITITPYKEGMDTEQTKRKMDIHADGYKQGYKDATEKAIEWLKANAHKYIVDIAVVQWERNLIVGGGCWNDLRKALEE